MGEGGPCGVGGLVLASRCRPTDGAAIEARLRGASAWPRRGGEGRKTTSWLWGLVGFGLVAPVSPKEVQLLVLAGAAFRLDVADSASGLPWAGIHWGG